MQFFYPKHYIIEEKAVLNWKKGMKRKVLYPLCLGREKYTVTTWEYEMKNRDEKT